MKTYRPGKIMDPELRKEFDAILQASLRADPFCHLQYLHSAPDKMLSGMHVLADGTDWNPGSGPGLYRRDETNTSWVFIG